MRERQARNALFDAFAEVAKALGNGRRAELIDILAQGERSVDQLATLIEQSVANTSFHLRVLASSGLVSTRREGTRIFYRLASDRVRDLWAALRDVAGAHHAGLHELAAAYLGDRSALEMIDRAEMSRRLELGDVVVIDVRDAEEYAAGHLAGARSIPISELQERLDTLPLDTEVVAYCRGTYCVYADDAVRLLRDNGYQARRLEDGYPEWRAAGLPVEVGAGGVAGSGRREEGTT